MKMGIEKKGQLLAVVIAFILISTVGWKLEANAGALLVQADGAQGLAAPRNTKSANILVIVTQASTGIPVTNLVQSNFSILNHFSVPGQVCGFSNRITSFVNIGTGAYQIQVGLPATISGCGWVREDYLFQVRVISGVDTGQATATLSIK